MKASKQNTLLSVLLLIVYTITYAISFTWETPIAFYYYGMTAVTALLFILFLRNLKPLYYAIFSFFTVMAQYFGSMLGGYHAISFYDLLLHFSSGILLILVGYLLYTALVRRYEIDSRAVLLPVLFSLFLAIAAAGLWEVYEFCGDTFFHLQAQGGSLTDTMTDIIAGSCGALIGAAFLASSLKKHKQPQKDKRQD